MNDTLLTIIGGTMLGSLAGAFFVAMGRDIGFGNAFKIFALSIVGTFWIMVAVFLLTRSFT